MGISTRWCAGMSTEDKDRFRKELKGSISVLERLSVLLEDDLRKSVKDAGLEAKYELAAWPHFQAHKLGEQNSLRKLLELIDIKE